MSLPARYSSSSRVLPFLLIAFLSVVALSAPIRAQDSPPVVEDFVTLGDANSQQATMQRLSAHFEGYRYETLVLAKMRNVKTVRLSESPLWRLDLRKAEDMDDPVGDESGYAPWTLIPPRKPAQGAGSPARWIHHGSLWFLAPEEGGTTQLEIQQAGDTVDLVWTAVQPGEFNPYFDGELDVRVRMWLDEDGYLESSLQVDIDNDIHGNGGAALLSAEFPSLVMRELDYGDEPRFHTHGWTDDVLLTPYNSGGLVAEPIRSLKFSDVEAVDSEHLGSGTPVGGPYSPSQTVYPGPITTQFFYYYDLSLVPDLEERWAEFDANFKMTRRGRPASERGGGVGVYVATHDSTTSLKRLLQYGLTFSGDEQSPPDRLALAIRNYVQYSKNDQPPLAAGRFDWTFYMGEDQPVDPHNKLRTLEYTATVRVLKGDWYDAVRMYGDWLESPEGLRNLLRDEEGRAVSILDRADPGLPPEERIPEPYLKLAAFIGVGEAGPEGFDARTQDPVGAQLLRDTGLSYTEVVKGFVSWLRQGSSLFGGDDWFAVGHGEGMRNDAGFGPAIKSSGSENGNRLPREGLVEFFEALRTPVLEEGWEGRVLSTLNRDTGRVAPDYEIAGIAARTDRGRGQRAEGDIIVSYSRRATLDAAKDLVADSMRMFVGSDGEESLVDLVLMSGQGSRAKPDYSLWYENDPLPVGVGGGPSWARGLGHLYKEINLLDPGQGVAASPYLFTGCERQSEATLRNVFSLGYYLSHPVMAFHDDNGFTGPGGERVLFEPVPLVTILYHPYTLLRIGAFSHAIYAFDTVLADGEEEYEADPELLEKSHRFASYRLAHNVISQGRVPVLFVSGDLQELDWTFSNRVPLGPADQARDNFQYGEPMWLVRNLVRARITARNFLVGGRRERDVTLIEAEGSPASWFPEEVRVLQHGLKPRYENVRELSFADLVVPRLVHGTWSLPGGCATPVGQVEVLITVANPSLDSNPTTYQTRYRVGFDPREWDLEPGSYRIRAHRFDWSAPLDAPGEVVFNHDDEWVESNPVFIDGQGVQFWSISVARNTQRRQVDRL